jgi:hypothetical protein
MSQKWQRKTDNKFLNFQRTIFQYGKKFFWSLSEEEAVKQLIGE